MSNKIRSYTELREFIRVSLRIQNPEWVAPNGDSPVCDSYEARFAEILGRIDPRFAQKIAKITKDLARDSASSTPRGHKSASEVS